jgi:hypothetical protein
VLYTIVWLQHTLINLNNYYLIFQSYYTIINLNKSRKINKLIS